MLLPEDEIRRGIERLAEQLGEDYRGEMLSMVGVLSGAVVFLESLVRELSLPVQTSFVEASSYRGTATEPGELRIDVESVQPVEGRHVLVVDDIFDTGRTLQEVMRQLRAARPRSIRSAVLLRKAERREVEIEPDYVVFDIPNRFVVGFGLDYDGRYRDLPYVAALEETDLAGDADPKPE